MMNNDFYKSIADALQQMDEKKKLDPVGKADADIDNDGDVDSSDEYLHKRRKAIKKSMAKEAADEMKKCPECGGSMENHEPDCSRAESSNKKKLEDDKDLDAGNSRKALKHDCATHVTSEQWGYGECIPGQHTLVEQEDGTGVVTHYDVMFEHGIEMDIPVESLTIVAEKHHMHAQKKHKMKEAKQPDQSGTKPEKMLDKFKGAGAKKMGTDNNVENPKHAEITPEEEGHDDASKAGRVTKQAPSRGNDNLTNGDKKPVKSGGK
jgi:hypothetical protein